MYPGTEGGDYGLFSRNAGLPTRQLGSWSGSGTEFHGDWVRLLEGVMGHDIPVFAPDFDPRGRTTDDRPQGRVRWCAGTVSHAD
jgi:hypothetical protein